MHGLSQELMQKLSDELQVKDNSPNQMVVIWRGDKKTSFEEFPFILPEVTRISVQRQWNMSADELEVEMSNVNGYYSPDYSNKKDYTNVYELPMSGYKGVIKAFNKVTCDLGYGDSLLRMFTGQVQNVNISEKSATINFNALNMYRKLIKPIDPVTTRELVYDNETAFNIVKDLCLRAGLNNELLIYDHETIDNRDFSINNIKFTMGTNYSDAIKEILTLMNHRVTGGRYGDINIIKNEIYSQRNFHNWEFDDYINLTDGNYEINTSVIRNRVVIISNNGWQAFEDKFLIDYCNGEVISCGVEVKWAETLEQKWDVADDFFIKMRRKLRRMTVAVIGNPAMDVGDLVRMKMLTSTANEKYMIIGIQSSFSESGYIDTVDLEYIGSGGVHLCEPAQGDYGFIEEDEEEKEKSDTSTIIMTLRDKIVNEALKYQGIYYQWGGNYPETKGHYGLDCSHFTYRVLKTFGLMNNYMTAASQKNWCKSITKDELKPGDLLFYSWNTRKIQHVTMYLGNDIIIGAQGGDSDVTTEAIAKARKAYVKVISISQGGKPYCYGRPQRLE